MPIMALAGAHQCALAWTHGPVPTFGAANHLPFSTTSDLRSPVGAYFSAESHADDGIWLSAALLQATELPNVTRCKYAAGMMLTKADLHARMRRLDQLALRLSLEITQWKDCDVARDVKLTLADRQAYRDALRLAAQSLTEARVALAVAVWRTGGGVGAGWFVFG